MALIQQKIMTRAMNMILTKLMSLFKQRIMANAIILILTSKFSLFGCRCSRRPSYGVNISQLIRFSRVYIHVTDVNA